MYSAACTMHVCICIHTCMYALCTMHCMYYDEPPNYLEFFGCPPPPCSPQKLRWWVHNEAGGPRARCPGIIWTFWRFETLALAFWRVFVCINTDAVTAKLDWRISLLIPPSHLVFLPTPPPPWRHIYSILAWPSLNPTSPSPNYLIKNELTGTSVKDAKAQNKTRLPVSNLPLYHCSSQVV